MQMARFVFEVLHMHRHEARIQPPQGFCLGLPAHVARKRFGRLFHGHEVPQRKGIVARQVADNAKQYARSRGQLREVAVLPCGVQVGAAQAIECGKACAVLVLFFYHGAHGPCQGGIVAQGGRLQQGRQQGVDQVAFQHHDVLVDAQGKQLVVA